jgi:isocitrate dehydrogenase
MKIAVAKGDGIGKEIMDSVLTIFDSAKVPLEYDIVPMGAEVIRAGEETGVSAEARTAVERAGVLFKGPMHALSRRESLTSVDAHIRALWGSFANKRVFRALPAVPQAAKRNTLDLTLVRAVSAQDAGSVDPIESVELAHTRRSATRSSVEAVHRYTFEMASRKRARRVTCAHDADTWRLTEGQFLDTFYEVSRDFPHISADDIEVASLATELVLNPSHFEVVVLSSVHGQVLSGLAAGLVGGQQYVPSADIGDQVSIFETAQGTEPEIAGRGLANPTALLLSGTMLLRQLGLLEYASAIETALGQTLHDMHRPPDLGQPIPTFRTGVFTETMCLKLQPLVADAALGRQTVA